MIRDHEVIARPSGTVLSQVHWRSCLWGRPEVTPEGEAWDMSSRINRGSSQRHPVARCSAQLHSPSVPRLDSADGLQILLLRAASTGTLPEGLIGDFSKLKTALQISPNTKERLHLEILRRKVSRCTRFTDDQTQESNPRLLNHPTWVVAEAPCHTQRVSHGWGSPSPFPNLCPAHSVPWEIGFPYLTGTSIFLQYY